MSGAHHTPGPWLHRGKSDSVCESPTPEQYAAGYRLGSVLFSFHEDEPPSDANLMLILAAPKMLDALKDALSVLEITGSYDYVTSRVRAAVAAAEAAA